MPPRADAAGRAPATWSTVAGWALLLLTILLVYGSLLSSPPLTWDDTEHIFANPYYAAGDWGAWWRQPYFGLYIPVMSTVWAVLYGLAGGAAWPFRVLNLLLHLANTALVARLAWHLLRSERTARPATALAVWVAAALFALHPLQVGAVAWISGARDLAATSFALLAMALFIGALGGARRTTWRLAFATAAFVVAVLCKPQVAGVPLALALWTLLMRDDAAPASGRPIALATLGLWAVFVAGIALLTRSAQHPPPDVAIGDRLLVAADALGWYLRKAIWPWPLSADYGRTPMVLAARPSLALGSIATLAVATGALLVWQRRDRRARIAWCWPLLLLPVLGLVPFAYQRISTVADHYAYLPLAILAVLVAMAVARVPAGRWRIATGVAVLLVAGAAIGSWQRTAVWRGGDEPFYRDMLATNAESFSARINLSVLQCERGEVTEGLALLEGASTLAHTDAPYLANEAFCLFQGGRHRDVVRLAGALRDPAARRGLDLGPREAVVFTNSIAAAFHALGAELAAFAWLCQGQAIAPDDANIGRNLDASRAALRAEGREVQCPGRLPWEQLLEAVRVD